MTHASINTSLLTRMTHTSKISFTFITAVCETLITTSIVNASTMANCRVFKAQLDHAARCISFTPGGRSILVGGYRIVHMYNVDSGMLVQTFQGQHKGNISGLAVTADGLKIISASTGDNTVCMWLTAGGAMIRTFEHSNDVWSMTRTPDDRFLITCTFFDDIVYVWDIADGSLVRTLGTHAQICSAVCDVAASPDSIHVVSALATGKVQLWKLNDGILVYSSQQLDFVLHCVAITANGEFIITGSNTGIIRLLRLTTGTQERVFRGHTDDIRSIAASTDGAHMVSGSDDGTVRVWSLVNTAARPLIFKGHTNGISSVVFHSNCKQIVSTSSDQTVRIWTICAWSDRCHQLFRADFKALVFCLMCVKARLDMNAICNDKPSWLPRLPMAMWLQVFAFLY